MTHSLSLASDAQKRVRDNLTYSAWGQSLTLPQWCAREENLRAHPWAQQNMRTWFLTNEVGDVLSSCETFRMNNYLALPSHKITQGFTEAIASVYTAPEHRGKGYASTMIKQLTQHMQQDDNVHAMTLYSDVGTTIYEQAGFQARPAFDRCLCAQEQNIKNQIDQWCTFDDLAEFWPEHPALRLQEFKLWPTPSQLDWHFERSRLYAQFLNRKLPQVWGARKGQSLIIWAPSYKTNDLLILAFYNVHQVEELNSLIGAARRIASECGLKQVLAWEDDLPLELWPASISCVPRTGGIPMLRSFRSDLHTKQWEWIPRILWV